MIDISYFSGIFRRSPLWKSSREHPDMGSKRRCGNCAYGSNIDYFREVPFAPVVTYCRDGYYRQRSC
jgi:hypothetical protein